MYLVIHILMLDSNKFHSKINLIILRVTWEYRDISTKIWHNLVLVPESVVLWLTCVSIAET